MGVTITYKFYCKDRECAKNALDKAEQKVLELKDKVHGMESARISDTEIIINPTPNCESIHLNFEPYAEKEKRTQKEGWNYEHVLLSKRKYVTQGGKEFDDFEKLLEYARKINSSWTDKIVGPLYNPKYYQTAAFTKTPMSASVTATGRYHSLNGAG